MKNYILASNAFPTILLILVSLIIIGMLVFYFHEEDKKRLENKKKQQALKEQNEKKKKPVAKKAKPVNHPVLTCDEEEKLKELAKYSNELIALIKKYGIKKQAKASEADKYYSNISSFAKTRNVEANRGKKVTIGISTISNNFKDGETVTLEELKNRVKGFDKKATFVKVLATGSLDKSLNFELDDYSDGALKMIKYMNGTASKSI